MSVPDYLNELLEIKQSCVYDIISIIKKQGNNWHGYIDKERVFKDISLSADDLGLINKTIDDEAHLHGWNKWNKRVKMRNLYEFLTSKGVKVTSDNVKHFIECGRRFYGVMFKNVKENTQLSQDILRFFMHKCVKKYNLSCYYYLETELRHPEFYIKLGLIPTIEDVKYCLKKQSPIKNIEQHSIIPSRELFDYCKSISCSPYYVYHDVPQTEIDLLENKVLMINQIEHCDYSLTLNKFKKMWKACLNITLDTQIVDAILNHNRLHTDVITYLLSMGVEITNEQINNRLSDKNYTSAPNGILWTLYYNKSKDFFK